MFITVPHSTPAPLYNVVSYKSFHCLRGVCLSPSTCSISPAFPPNPAWTLLEPGPGRCSHLQPPWTKPGFPWQPQRVHVCKGVSLQLQSPGPLATLELIPVCAPHGIISKQGRTTALIRNCHLQATGLHSTGKKM